MKRLKVIDIIQQLLPPSKRKPVMLSFLKVLTAPIQTLNNWIAGVYYPDVERRTKWNAQVMLFSKLLNDLHNAGDQNNQVFINGGVSDLEHNYFFNLNENSAIDLYNTSESLPLFSHNLLEFEAPYDFQVNYPTTLNLKAKQIESSVRKYKVVGTNYTMKSYAPAA